MRRNTGPDLAISSGDPDAMFTLSRGTSTFHCSFAILIKAGFGDSLRQRIPSRRLQVSIGSFLLSYREGGGKPDFDATTAKERGIDTFRRDLRLRCVMPTLTCTRALSVRVWLCPPTRPHSVRRRVTQVCLQSALLVSTSPMANLTRLSQGVNRCREMFQPETFHCACSLVTPIPHRAKSPSSRREDDVHRDLIPQTSLYLNSMCVSVQASSTDVTAVRIFPIIFFSLRSVRLFKLCSRFATDPRRSRRLAERSRTGFAFTLRSNRDD